MAEGMPQGIYEYLTKTSEYTHGASLLVAWYPFLEPAHNSGYSPNAAYRQDSSESSLSLNSFSSGEGVRNGELHIPNASASYVKQVGYNNPLQLNGELTIVLWYKWEGIGGIDSSILKFKGDIYAPGSTNCLYEILIDGNTNAIKLSHEYGGDLYINNDTHEQFYMGETYDLVTTSFNFPKDGNYHLITVRRDSHTIDGKSWYVSLDGFPEKRYDYNRPASEGSEGYSSYLYIGGRPGTERGYGSFKGIYIFGGKLPYKDVQYIASFGPPEPTWFDYSNWNSNSNSGFVTWKAVEAPYTFKAIRKGLLNEIVITWDTYGYVDNFILQRDINSDFSNPIELYSGPGKNYFDPIKHITYSSYTDTITTTGYYYYRVKSQSTSLGIDSGWVYSYTFFAVNTWEWDFKDGRTLLNERNFLSIYPEGGVYYPSLRIYNDFLSNIYTSPDPVEVISVVHEWDLGDGSPKVFARNPVHTYTSPGVYNVTQKVTNLINNEEVTYPLYVTALMVPYADFYGTPTRGEKRLTTTFVDTSYGDFTEWLWNFGDGIFSTERNPVHYYRRPGIYTVSLTVRGVPGEYSRVRVNYIIVNSDRTIDIAPEPDKDMYLRGLGSVFKRKLGIEIKRVTGIS